MGGMAERGGERVGGVGADIAGRRQQPPHHEGDLRLVGPAGADQGFLDRRRRIFRDAKPRARTRRERHAARLAERQGRARIGIDERLLHRSLVRAMRGDDGLKAAHQLAETHGERLLGVWRDHAMRDVSEPRAFAGDHAPAAAREARINAEDEDGAHRHRHCARLVRAVRFAHARTAPIETRRAIAASSFRGVAARDEPGTQGFTRRAHGP